jgi:dephospho-CoA kinase
VLAVILDAPVLVKAGWDHLCDHIVFVETNEPSRRQRATARGWSVDEWRRREALQTPLDQLRRLADAVVDNSGPPEDTEQQVRQIWRDWGLNHQGASSDPRGT